MIALSREFIRRRVDVVITLVNKRFAEMDLDTTIIIPNTKKIEVIDLSINLREIKDDCHRAQKWCCDLSLSQRLNSADNAIEHIECTSRMIFVRT